MLSIWEQRSFVDYDVIIIGAGITGLSTAASLKEKDAKLNILVLERGLLPTGASTKNAGFACFGSLSELQNDISTLGEEKAQDLVQMRWNGLLKTRSRLGDQKIGFQQKGGYELIFDDSDYQKQMSKVNSLLRPLFDQDVFKDATNQLSSTGFAGTKQLIFNKFEGQLDTGKLIKGLWNYCNQLGIQVVTGALVTHLEKHKVIANIRHAFTAKKIILCTNAFTNGLIEDNHTRDIHPGRGMVLAIRPQNKLQFQGTFHYNQGYYYFRDLDDLVIFGGGRNLDPDTENTTLFEVNQTIRSKLLQDLREIILPSDKFEIVKEWTGIMAFGQNKCPIIHKHPEGWYLGVRLGGMGVAIGSQVGEELARMVITDGL